MLRRLPTALAISPEDVQEYEEKLAKYIAHLKYKKTGEDPEGLFSGDEELKARKAEEREENREKPVDPNDELKPLPGQKAQIIRGRDERIMGVPGGRGR